ncbi:AraC family transcriptional regulator [Vibrio profundum]|uniref:helix-turn-helix transcriptional regulator n=1 Tax=Vibrio profundum TaxID=2910247 RepID=UPI003D0E7A9D
MTNLYQITHFRAGLLQKLRNVRIHSPTIVQVLSGSKKLFWNEKTSSLSPSSLLLCEASLSLSFDNQPDKGHFSSRMFSLFSRPSESMLRLSYRNEVERDIPAVRLDSALSNTLNILQSLELLTMSVETQSFYLMALYQQLAEKGVLHWLFSNEEATFGQKLRHYLSQHPGAEHSLISVAEQFAMSRATFSRRLKQEGYQYREVLAEIRLSYALRLMQQGSANVSILSHMCGYQSESRFCQRFKSKFGVSPAQYIKTIGPSAP